MPNLLYGDTTSESLAFDLATKWPSSGVLSNEAGIVFGGHAMGRESITRNLGLLNSLWGGGGHKVNRRTTEAFNVAGVRLTMGLAVQPQTVRTFFENSKGLARGSGFAARFLIAWPSSTQGERSFKAPPESWPHLSAFHRRMTALLDQVPVMNERGELELPVLDLSPEAKDAWVYYHDEIETALKPGGDMADTRDVASKAADNAARLAALFHLYEHEAPGSISAEHMRAPYRIVTWHLYEARRFLSELVLPPTASNAAKLNAWLLQHCRVEHVQSVNAGYVLQFGPLRDKRTRDEAIAALEEAGRVRLLQHKRQKDIEVNPTLLRSDHDTA